MRSRSGPLARLVLALKHNPRGVWSGRHLLLLSHVRAGSSPLAQVLGAHPEICGHSEQKTRYRTWLDFLRVRVSLGATDASFPSQRIYLDQVLDNAFQPEARRLTRDRCVVLVVVRSPGSALHRLVYSHHRHGSVERLTDPRVAAAHYVGRLEGIVELVRRADCPKLFVSSESLREVPAGVLCVLRDWLKLEQPLSTRYRPLASHGELPFASATTAGDAVYLKSLEQCQKAYDACRPALAEFCDMLPVPPPHRPAAAAPETAVGRRE